MKKRFKLILGLFALATASLVLAGCTSKTALDEYRKKGYTVSVTYDSNGGIYLGRSGVTLMDLFRPTDYTADGNGEVHIKLTEPTDPDRPTGSSDPITLTKSGYFFAGWYQTREIKTNESGKAVDEQGVELQERNGAYYYDGDEESLATPAYSYSDYWDFENDTVDYTVGSGEIFSMTLYAGWVPYYEFEYYYRENGAWKLYGSTAFDYKTVNADAGKADKDTIWLPDWKDGAMGYSHKYADGSVYNFPQIADTTFSAAYTDEECTQKIDVSYRHPGTLDVEHAQAVNRVQKIYVALDEGERYRIETAQQFVEHVNPKGIYEILSDLDFDGLSWPAAYTANPFKGQIYGAEGRSFAFKNISATYNNTTLYGGLFGYVAEGAVIRNISFENATLDIASAIVRSQGAQFGLFAGEIAEGAAVSGVSVDGMIKIGVMSLGEDYSVNLLANGNTDGVTAGKISLRIYGEDLILYYNYRVDPDGVTVDGDGNVILNFVTRLQKEKEYYDIISEE